MFTELRSRLSDDVAPYKWSDAFLLSVLAEGQDKFCEETGYFVDFSNYAVTLQTGVAVYAVPTRAIEVLDIWDGTRRLGKYQESDRSAVTQDWDPAVSASQSGRPQRWQTDRSTGSITFDRVPTAVENGVVLQLRVWRYSRYALDGDGPVANVVAEPEIPSRFHRAPIEWAAFKAYTDHDAEKADRVKAETHERNFAAYCRDGKRALQRIQGHSLRVGTAPAYRT